MRVASRLACESPHQSARCARGQLPQRVGKQSGQAIVVPSQPKTKVGEELIRLDVARRHHVAEAASERVGDAVAVAAAEPLLETELQRVVVGPAGVAVAKTTPGPPK